MADKLAAEERAAALSVLATSGWAHDADRDALKKTFKFKNNAAKIKHQYQESKQLNIYDMQAI